MITYCFLASNIAGPVGGTIGSILVLVIVSIICCIAVVVIRKNTRDKMLEVTTLNKLSYKQLDLLKQLKQQI